MRRVGALRAPLAPAAKASPSIIDVHTHFYDSSKPWPGPHETLLYRTVLPADFMSVASPVGVTGAVWKVFTKQSLVDGVALGLSKTVAAASPLYLFFHAQTRTWVVSPRLGWSPFVLVAESSAAAPQASRVSDNIHFRPCSLPSNKGVYVPSLNRAKS